MAKAICSQTSYNPSHLRLQDDLPRDEKPIQRNQYYNLFPTFGMPSTRAIGMAGLW